MSRRPVHQRARPTVILPVLWIISVAPTPTILNAAGFLYFDVQDLDGPTDDSRILRPWRVVHLDPDCAGQWVVAGDIDNDNEVEIVAAENFNANDVHYTSAAAVHELDSTVKWRWGDPEIGRKVWHHDVALQIHDWDADGDNEVVLCTKGFIVELDGHTGKQNRRIPIDDEATDCLTFCDLAGRGHPSDVLVKDRYHRIWAYNVEGKLLWTVKDPGGYRTAHQARPIDIDGDGKDEILAGYALLNSDGSVRWCYESKALDASRGHLDCARVLRRGKSPGEFRFALTCCGANNITVIDGRGDVVWEIRGHHFESIDIGRVFGDHPGPQIVVDIDHQPYGRSPIWVLDEKGQKLAQLVTNYSRHHGLLDWTGDGLDEILVAHDRGIYNQQGKRIATFGDPPGRGKGSYEKSLLIGDMTGDGVPDALIATPTAVYIYKNANGKQPTRTVPLGTEHNFTLY